MDTGIFDALARRAAMSRRGSLRALGGAAMTGVLAAPMAASAGKAGRKAPKRCQRQRGQCLAFVKEFCAPKELPEVCQGFLSPCCADFASCRAGEGIACLFGLVLV